MTIHVCLFILKVVCLNSELANNLFHTLKMALWAPALRLPAAPSCSGCLQRWAVEAPLAERWRQGRLEGLPR